MREIQNVSKITCLGIILILGLLMTNCDSPKLQETPIERFEGTWELTGRVMFEGIKVKIEKNSEGELSGKIVSLNDNKYLKMLAESGDTWVKSISRSSNYEFKLTEKKIGSDLFSLYGLSTTAVYKAQFIDENTIGLASVNSDPVESLIKYIRIE